ncbi:hypothetical protein C8R46DRAFT_1163679 [Mycena filopes]|nr:hypothetical protein C8R46DRAFT_1163679 [Mycena filopes]
MAFGQAVGEKTRGGQQRRRRTQLKWVKGHNGHERNEGADKKPEEGANKQTHDEVPLTIPPVLKVTGAKLSAMTQSLAYKVIREKKMKAKLKKREHTKVTIEKIKAEVEDTFGFIPTEAKIWKSSPEQKEHSNCAHCGKVDSMEHILSQCEIPGQKEVWDLAKRLWAKRNPDWPWPGIGVILGVGLASFKDADGKIKPGDARLYRILIAESAYLIWKLRGERIMQHNGRAPTEIEIHNCWVKTMNVRLKMDCDMTNCRH